MKSKYINAFGKKYLILDIVKEDELCTTYLVKKDYLMLLEVFKENEEAIELFYHRVDYHVNRDLVLCDEENLMILIEI